MSTRESVGPLRDLYGIDLSPDLIGAVTDAELEQVAAWQARPLERVYALIFFDALRVEIRDKGLVANRPFISCWARAPTAARKFRGSGSSRTRPPNSGCAS